MSIKTFIIDLSNFISQNSFLNEILDLIENNNSAGGPKEQ